MADRSDLLAAAVLRQAVVDLFSRVLSGASREDYEIERLGAMRFLTEPNGKWALMRDHWCTFADVDADELRARIIDVLEGKRDIELAERTYRLNGHDIARALWAKEKAKHVAFLNDAREKVAARNAQAESHCAARNAEAEAERLARMRIS